MINLILVIVMNNAFSQNSFYTSKNMNQFWMNLKQQERNESIQANCHWEIQHNKFPYSCQKLYLQYLLNPELAVKAQHQFKMINRLCLKNASLESNKLKLETFLGQDFISLGCQRIVRERIKDLEYQSNIGSNLEMNLADEKFSAGKNSL